MRLTAAGQRVLGCLLEKSLATPEHYPLSINALRTACNQTTGRDPVVTYDDEDVRAGLDELKRHQLVRTEYSRGSRVPKAAHRVDEQLDLDPAQRTALALLLLRGPQTTGEIRSRAGRMHTFASVELVEAVLGSLEGHRFGPLATRRAREPGRREARWAHLLGDDEVATAPGRATAPEGATAPGATSAPGATTAPEGATGPGATAGSGGTTAAAAGGPPRGRYRAFHDAILADDLDTAVAQLAPDVVFRSPAVHRPYEGHQATAAILRAVSRVFEDFRYVDVLDDGDRAGLVFEARVGDREVQGWDYLRFDDEGRITEFTVMIRPLSGLQAVVEGMRDALGG